MTTVDDFESKRRDIELACILEATARKAGNVHPGRDFATSGYCDFLCSAVAIGPVLAKTDPQCVGRSVLEAVRATGSVAKSNTNLGIVLLLAPLAAADELTSRGVGAVLRRLTVADSQAVYQAIREANPGGLGTAAEQDVRGEVSIPLTEAMALAADRDLIARQYVVNFADVFDLGVDALSREFETGSSVEEAIVRCHLQWMAAFPDSLIARKRGEAEARQSSRMAREVLDSAPRTRSLLESDAFRRLDEWLAERGNARNPGTSADLVAASLYVFLRKRQDADIRWTPFGAGGRGSR